MHPNHSSSSSSSNFLPQFFSNAGALPSGTVLSSGFAPQPLHPPLRRMSSRLRAVTSSGIPQHSLQHQPPSPPLRAGGGSGPLKPDRPQLASRISSRSHQHPHDSEGRANWLSGPSINVTSVNTSLSVDPATDPTSYAYAAHAHSAATQVGRAGAQQCARIGCTTCVWCTRCAVQGNGAQEGKVQFKGKSDTPDENNDRNGFVGVTVLMLFNKAITGDAAFSEKWMGLNMLGRASHSAGVRGRCKSMRGHTLPGLVRHKGSARPMFCRCEVRRQVLPRGTHTHAHTHTRTLATHRRKDRRPPLQSHGRHAMRGSGGSSMHSMCVCNSSGDLIHCMTGPPDPGLATQITGVTCSRGRWVSVRAKWQTTGVECSGSRWAVCE
eukprot:scaffold86379_cov21-Tisochrysis_lutea.AAC.1